MARQRKQTGFAFDFAKHIAETPEILTDHFVHKIQNVNSKIGKQEGPYVKWMTECQDDSEFFMPDGGFKNGIPTISRLFNNFMSGFAVIGGLPNHGKSTVILQMQHHGLKLNEDLVIFDCSLDDPIEKRFVQMVCNISGLTYQQIYSQGNLTDEERDRKREAVKQIKAWIREGRYFPLEGFETFGWKTSTGAERSVPVLVRQISQIIRLHESAREAFPDSKIAFMIDAWNDVEIDGEDFYAGETALKDLKAVSNDNGVMTFMTAHLNKVGGRASRATLNDIKGTKKLEYDAVYGGILRNEYKDNPLGNFLYVEREGLSYPAVVLETLKSKCSIEDRPWFAALDGPRCQLIPLTAKEYLDTYAMYRSVRK